MDKTLLKGLLLIEALAKSDAPRGVTDLGKQLGLTKSNVYRLLQTLVAQGYVKHDTATGKYSSSLRLWELGCLALNRLDLMVQGKPHLERLAELTHETVHLSILEGDWIIYIDKIDSPEPVRAYSQIGGRAPAHCVATGKVLLAFRVFHQETWPLHPLKRFTKKTITTTSMIRAELSRIRELGYSVNNGEWRDSVKGLAAPIYGSSGDVIAAVGISGPAERLKARQIKEFTPMVVAAGEAISADLGAPTSCLRNARTNSAGKPKYATALGY